MAKDEVFTRFLSDSDEEVHVLAVDDSLVDRKVIEKLLKITSCRVTAVDSGIRALQFLGLLGEEETSVGFDGLKVDLIITDYCMPEMTGYDLLKKIKGSSTFRQIPVVIMSSENILARIHRCLEEGAEDFIVKPVKLLDVKRLKTSVFGEGRVQRQQAKGVANKRKMHENSDASMPESPSSSPCPDNVSSSPSLPFTSSRCTSRSCSLSPPQPSLPTALDDSPARRIKLDDAIPSNMHVDTDGLKATEPVT